MRIVDRLQETIQRVTGRTEIARLAEVLQQDQQTVSYQQESMVADLEARMREPGWQLLTSQAEQEFSRDGLRQIAAVCRVMAIKNPLIKRGLQLRQGYVWGQGVEISARATGKSHGGQDVNELVQQFLDDAGNQRVFTGHQAREALERALGTDGNVFLACFTKPRSGSVQVRLLPFDQITHVITNPEDDSEPWFYRREWYSEHRDQRSDGIIERREISYYPAMGYRPRIRPPRISFPNHGDGGLAPVIWDAPVYHVKVGGLSGWKFGIGDAYAALDWAHAYKDFLTDWARLVKSLARFAWKLTTKGSKQAAAKTRIAAAPTRDASTGDSNHAGATALNTPDMALEAIPKSGATIDSESGRPLAAMVAAAMDLPVTMLLGDPGVTGARATAETLDAPTERAMQSRRQVWADAIRAILNHVIKESVRAPDGALKGTITVDEWGREVVALAGKTEATIDISWPDLDDVDIATVIDAITKADATTYIPPLVVARLLLEALDVQDVDAILELLVDEDGNFLRPDGAGGGAGQAAVNAFRRGRDPAALLGGDDPPPGEDEPDEA